MFAASRCDRCNIPLSNGRQKLTPFSSYGVEEGVGRGIKRSGVPREEIFVTSKLWCNAHHPNDVRKACEDSLKKLDCGYLDLYLMHYPFANRPGPEMHPKDKNGNPDVVDIDYVDVRPTSPKVMNVVCNLVLTS